MHKTIVSALRASGAAVGKKNSNVIARFCSQLAVSSPRFNINNNAATVRPTEPLKTIVTANFATWARVAPMISTVRSNSNTIKVSKLTQRVLFTAPTRFYARKAPTQPENEQVEDEAEEHLDQQEGVANAFEVPGEEEEELEIGSVISGGARKEGQAPPEIFAIIHIGGKQYKVTKGDLIITEKIEADIGQQIALQKVLLVGGKKFTSIGRPLVQGATVLATVEEKAKSAKTITFKKKRRKNHRRLKGHRQPLTVLRIDDVVYEVPQVEETKVVAVE